MVNVGSRLKALREDRDLSQIEVAEALGINNSVLSRIENGKRPVEDDLLSKFAQFYGVTSDYLLGLVRKSTQTRELPQTVAPYLPEGFTELSPEAKKEVLDYVEYIMAKYAKKEEKDKN